MPRSISLQQKPCFFKSAEEADSCSIHFSICSSKRHARANPSLQSFINPSFGNRFQNGTVQPMLANQQQDSICSGFAILIFRKMLSVRKSAFMFNRQVFLRTGRSQSPSSSSCPYSRKKPMASYSSARFTQIQLFFFRSRASIQRASTLQPGNVGDVCTRQGMPCQKIFLGH